MNQTKTILEQVSALADGQLDDAALTRLMAISTPSVGVPEAAHGALALEVQAAWGRYHLIGEVLRTGRHAPCSDSAAFMARFRQRLADEPVTLPRATVGVPTAPALAPIVHHAQVEAANAPLFRWKLVAGVASLALAVAVGWNWLGSAPSPAGGQLAQTQSRPAEQPVADQPIAGQPVAEQPVAVASNVPPQTMLRNARLDELLAAHQQAAGRLQTPSIFLRNATFEAPSR